MIDKQVLRVGRQSGQRWYLLRRNASGKEQWVRR